MIELTWVGLRYSLKTVILIYLCLLSVDTVLGQKTKPEKNDYILLINSYAESAFWSNKHISVVAKFAKNHSEVDLYAEHMNMLMVDNDTILNEFKQNMFRKYNEHPPRFMVLLGNSALILRDDIQKAWGDMPIILCAEKDFVGANENYLKKQRVLKTDQKPTSNLADPYNLVLLYSDLYLAENIRLIHHMIPDMNKFIFVGDEAFVNQQNAYELGEWIEKNYPQITYEFLSSQDLTTDELMDTLNHIDCHTTGVLFSTWFSKQFFGGNVALMTSSHKVIATSSAPLFVLRGLGIMEDGGIVGGYVYDQEEYDRNLTGILSEVLQGRQPRDIPFYRPAKTYPFFNYESLLQRGMSPSLCPHGSIFFRTSPTFWEQYKYGVLGGCFMMIIVFLFFQYKRIQTLQKLKDFQQREIEVMTDFRNLIDNMPILYMQEKVILNQSGEAVDTEYYNVNAYFEKNFFKKDEIIGKRGSEVFPESIPDFMHFIRIALKEKRVITFPYYFKKIHTFYNIVLKESHRPGMIDIFCIDSTELHQAQQQLSSINHKLALALEVADIVPWKWDLQSKTILCDINKPIELSTRGNYVKEDQLSVPDAQYFSKIYKADRSRVEQAYQDLIDGKVEKVKEEYRVIDVHNHTHKIDWVEAQAVVEKRDTEGKPLILVGSSLVITSRKKMEEELTMAKDRAEESNRLKSAFLANMSHEIRTPLNAIVGFSGILASTEEEQEKKEYVNIIENNNALLLQLISDILDLSKIEAGSLDFQYSDIELNTVMRELENTLKLRVKSEAVKLEFIPSLPVCPIRMEKNRLSQVLINLITNAIKFTQQGSIRFGYERRNKELYFYVKDTGRGIPEDKQESIFGRFVKLDNFAQGTGLGLSICQTIVERMGGKIGVESVDGEGAIFWFTLPYQPVALMEKCEQEFIPIRIDKDKLTILIAEDNESNYKLFESILKNDYRLIHAWDGQEAVELFKLHNPQIVLMDINMPVMNGYEATLEIRKCSAKVPIIAVTAFAYASDEQKVMESGFDGYMPKPINARQLKAQLLDIMQKRIVFL